MSNEHDHGGHSHGDPFVWDPDARRTRVGRWLVVLGSLVIALGAWLWWQGGGPRSSVPLPTDFESASGELKAVLAEPLESARQAPADAQRLGTLGLAYEANRLWTAARECYRRAAELDPDSPDWPYRAAIADIELGELAAARDGLLDLEARFPAFAPAAYLQGELALDSQDLDRAVRSFERAASAAPDSPEAHTGLGHALRGLGQLDAARAALERAVELDPAYDAPHALLARVLEQQGDEARARDERALGADEQRRRMGDPMSDRLSEYFATVDEQLQRALELLRWRQHEPAERLLRKILERHPDEPRALVNLGFLQLEQGRFAEALATLRRAEALAPEELKVQLNLAACLIAIERPRDAEAAARRALELQPESGQASFLLGQCLYRAGDRNGAVEPLQAACRLEPSNPIFASELVQLYAALGRNAEAAEESKRLAALLPGHWEPLANAAEFHLRADELDAAADSVAAARELAPEVPELARLAEEIDARRAR